MRLTTKSRYGLRLMLDLAFNAKNGPVSLNDIAIRQKISFKYLEKLVRKLKAAGLIESRRGACGGHELARDRERISVGQIVRVLEEQSAIAACAERLDYECGYCKEASDCLARLVWIEASKALFACLDEITLDILVNQRQDFMKNGSQKKNMKIRIKRAHAGRPSKPKLSRLP
jgi:Rrf2 family transcriptional regulator, iron-sulfur cluster assembly transcription factor